MKKPNRVWIEIEMPVAGDNFIVVAEARAAVFIALIRKLVDGEDEVTWNNDRCCYNHSPGARHGSCRLNQKEPGFWFNLDFMAMSTAEQEAA